MGCVAAKAQNLNSAYFVDDFKFRHSLNPAYGNEQTYLSIPALGNVNVSLQGNFGVKDVIMDNPLYGQPGQKRLTNISQPKHIRGGCLKWVLLGKQKTRGGLETVGSLVRIQGIRGGYISITTTGHSVPHWLTLILAVDWKVHQPCGSCGNGGNGEKII